MPIDPDRVAPAHTALVINECQRMVVGDRTSLPALREAAVDVLPTIDRLAEGARRAGVQVVHCLVHRRPDMKGSNTNTRFAARAKKFAEQGRNVYDPEGFDVVPEIRVDERDLVLPRIHASSAMTDTGLDIILRNCGVRTVVVAGVSLNVGVMGLAIEAANRAYEVYVPTDAVAGVPKEYAQLALEHTYAMIARLTTADELLTAWGVGA